MPSNFHCSKCQLFTAQPHISNTCYGCAGYNSYADYETKLMVKEETKPDQQFNFSYNYSNVFGGGLYGGVSTISPPDITTDPMDFSTSLKAIPHSQITNSEWDLVDLCSDAVRLQTIPDLPNGYYFSDKRTLEIMSRRQKIKILDAVWCGNTGYNVNWLYVAKVVK